MQFDINLCKFNSSICTLMLILSTQRRNLSFFYSKLIPIKISVFQQYSAWKLSISQFLLPYSLRNGSMVMAKYRYGEPYMTSIF